MHHHIFINITTSVTQYGYLPLKQQGTKPSLSFFSDSFPTILFLCVCVCLYVHIFLCFSPDIYCTAWLSAWCEQTACLALPSLKKKSGKDNWINQMTSQTWEVSQGPEQHLLWPGQPWILRTSTSTLFPLRLLSPHFFRNAVWCFDKGDRKVHSSQLKIKCESQPFPTHQERVLDKIKDTNAIFYSKQRNLALF